MNQEFERTVGQNIKRYREMRGFTQEQLPAQLETRGCDVTRSALAKMETGLRHIYPDELKLLKALLGVSYEELLSE